MSNFYVGTSESIEYHVDEHQLRDGDVVSAWAFAVVCVAAVLALAAVYVM